MLDLYKRVHVKCNESVIKLLMWAVHQVKEVQDNRKPVR